MAGKSSATIQFNYSKTTFRLKSSARTRAWIEKVIKSEGATPASISYVFCTDSYLLKINQGYLDHDTLTDVITFEYTEPGTANLEGEIYISVPRVRENAKTLGVNFETELRRVIIHGVLHLLGFKDKTKVQREEIRRKEDKALGVWVPRGT